MKYGVIVGRLAMLYFMSLSTEKFLTLRGANEMSDLGIINCMLNLSSRD